MQILQISLVSKIFTLISLCFLIYLPSNSRAEGNSNDSLGVPRFRYIDPLKAGFQPFYFRYQPLILTEDSVINQQNKNEASKDPFADSKFAKLEKKGTIYRGFTVGSDKNFAINSGLNLFLEGELYKDFKLKAVLNDQNMPISSAGSTALVEEIDNIYIQIEHPNFLSRMGNYQLERQNAGVYGNFNKKLTGVYLSGQILPFRAEMAISSARNQFKTVEIIAKQDNQGPYRLFESNGINALNMIGGTEKVFLNGTLLKAGNSNDYYLDYESGELSFTAKRPIVENDRISVDFEYNDNDYKKNIFFAGHQGSWGKENKISWQSAWYSGSDDSKKPLGFELNTVNRQLLAAASPKTKTILVSGEKFIGKNLGTYQKIITDSVNSLFYYKYAGFGKGDYEVVFTKVEQDGKYARNYDSTGTLFYKLVSSGGEYLPVKLIKTPESHQFGQIIANYSNQWLQVEQETVFSHHLNNSLSSNAVSDFDGLADREKVVLFSPELEFKQTEIGKLSLKLERSFKNKYLVTPGRSSQPDNSYNLGLGYNPDSLMVNSYSAGLNYSYLENVNSDLEYAKQSFGNDLSSSYFAFSGSGNGDLLYKSNWLVARRTTDDLERRQNLARENWSGDLTVKLWKNYFFTPEHAVELEKINLQDSLLGHENRLYGFKMAYNNFDNLEISNLTRYEEFDQVKNRKFTGYMQRRSNIFNTEYRLGTILKSSLVWNHRENYFLVTDSQNVKFDLASTGHFFNWQDKIRGSLEYEAGKTEESKKIRQFYQVTDGYGGYSLINGQFVPDEYGIYASYLLNSGQYFPVTDVKVNAELYLDPDELADNKHISYWFSRFDLDGRWKLEEKSKWGDPVDIIMLNLSKFRSDSTLSGIFEADQTVYFMQSSPFNLDYRYFYSDRLNNSYLMNGEVENLVTHAFSSRQKWNSSLITRLSTEYGKDDISYLHSSYQSRNIISKSYKSSLSYQLNSEWRLSLALRYREDADNKNKLTSFLYEISPSLEVQFLEQGRIYSEINYYQVKADAVLPLQMADGYKMGDNWKWQLNSSYNITDKISSSINYNGRKLVIDEKTIHELSMEIRMSF